MVFLFIRKEKIMSNLLKSIVLLLTINAIGLRASELNNTNSINNTIEHNQLLTGAIADINNRCFMEAKNKLKQFSNNVKPGCTPQLTKDMIIKVLENTNPISTKLHHKDISRDFYYKSINAIRDVLLYKLKDQNVKYRCFAWKPQHRDIEHLILSNHIFNDIGENNAYLNFVPIDGIKSLPYYEDIHELAIKVYDKKNNMLYSDFQQLIYSIVNRVLVTPILNKIFEDINSGLFISSIYASDYQDNSYEYPVLLIKIISNTTHNEIKLNINYCKDKNQVTVNFLTLYGNTEESYNFEKKKDECALNYKEWKASSFNYEKQNNTLNITSKNLKHNNKYNGYYLQNKTIRESQYDDFDDNYAYSSSPNDNHYKKVKKK